MSKGLLVTIDGLSALFARLKMRFYRPRRPLPYGRGSELHGVSARNVFVLLGGPRRAMGAPLKVSVWRGWSGLVRQGVGCREGTRLRYRKCGGSDAWPGCPREAVRDWGRATFIVLGGARMPAFDAIATLRGAAYSTECDHTPYFSDHTRAARSLGARRQSPRRRREVARPCR